MRLLLLVTALASLGCHPQPRVVTNWTKPGYDDATFIRDRYDCERDTRMAADSFSRDVGYRVAEANQFFTSCLIARGYAPVTVNVSADSGRGPSQSECQAACNAVGGSPACYENCRQYPPR